jgi:hypothetical protein
METSSKFKHAINEINVLIDNLNKNESKKIMEKTSYNKLMERVSSKPIEKPIEKPVEKPIEKIEKYIEDMHTLKIYKTFTEFLLDDDEYDYQQEVIIPKCCRIKMTDFEYIHHMTYHH